jgi:hypothetical protein
VAAEKSGSTSAWFPLLGAALCFAIRMVGLRRGFDAPTAPTRVRHDDRV